MCCVSISIYLKRLAIITVSGARAIDMNKNKFFRSNPILLSHGNKSGQTLVEYALIVALISLVAVSVLSAMGIQAKGVFSAVSSQLATAGSGGSGGSGGSSGSSGHGG